MIIGVPREIKKHEYRVALRPVHVTALVEAGHRVLVEKGAGLGINATDEDYERAGASVLLEARQVYGDAELIVKVKEPVEEEYGLLQDGQILFTYLHLAAVPALADVLVRKRITGIAYETIIDQWGELPLLKPMSQIAGRMSVQLGAHYLFRFLGGRGTLLGGIPGVHRGVIAVIGAGVSGSNAVDVAVGMGAHVIVLDKNPVRLEDLEHRYANRIETLVSNRENIMEVLSMADLFIGAVLVPGGRAPTLVSREDLALMKQHAVIVDISVDQGGCVETIRPTTHDNPVYDVDGVLHYGVANMPGAVPLTSTEALTNATFPYLMSLVSKGLAGAIKDHPGLAHGFNTYAGNICHPQLANDLSLSYEPLKLT